jgi:hypothetical protein
MLDAIRLLLNLCWEYTNIVKSLDCTKNGDAIKNLTVIDEVDR